MKQNRKYIASCDNGHDYFSFEFYSTHRANSKANKEDAIYEFHRSFGWRKPTPKILNTYLCDYY